MGVKHSKSHRLQIACATGDLPTVKSICKEFSNDISPIEISSSASSPLIDFLLSPSAEGDLPLHISCAHNSYSIVEFFLSSFPSLISHINHRDNNGLTPLLCSVLGDSNDSVSLLLRYGQEVIDVNLKDLEGNSPLQVACKQGNGDVVKMLLSFHGNSKALIEYSDSHWNSPLLLTIAHWEPRYTKGTLPPQRQIALESLLLHGADSNVHNDRGQGIFDIHKDNLYGEKMIKFHNILWKSIRKYQQKRNIGVERGIIGMGRGRGRRRGRGMDMETEEKETEVEMKHGDDNDNYISPDSDDDDDRNLTVSETKILQIIISYDDQSRKPPYVETDGEENENENENQRDKGEGKGLVGGGENENTLNDTSSSSSSGIISTLLSAILPSSSSSSSSSSHIPLDLSSRLASIGDSLYKSTMTMTTTVSNDDKGKRKEDEQHDNESADGDQGTVSMVKLMRNHQREEDGPDDDHEDDNDNKNENGDFPSNESEFLENAVNMDSSSVSSVSSVSSSSYQALH